MFTYSHANTPLGQSERTYYLSYFINEFSLFFQPNSNFSFGMDAIKCSVLSRSLKKKTYFKLFFVFFFSLGDEARSLIFERFSTKTRNKTLLRGKRFGCHAVCPCLSVQLFDGVFFFVFLLSGMKINPPEETELIL